MATEKPRRLPRVSRVTGRTWVKGLMTSAAFVAAAFQPAPATAQNTRIGSGDIGAPPYPAVDTVSSPEPTTNAIVVGQGAKASGSNPAVIGVGANAYGVNAIAVGASAFAWAAQPVSGTVATYVPLPNPIAIGSNARAEGEGATGIGGNYCFRRQFRRSRSQSECLL